MKKAFRIYNDILSYIAILGLIGFLVCVTIQVAARTFLPTSPNWTEEAARFLFIFMVGFAGNAAVAKDEYVGVELLTERFPAGMQKLVKILVLTAICLFSGFIFFFCIVGPDGLLAMTPATMVSTAMTLPMKMVYISIAILFGLYVVSYIMRIICIVKDINIYEKEEA